MSQDSSKEELFKELIDRFARFIYSHIQKYHLSRFGLDAEDIAQDIRLKIWKVIRDKRPIHNYASYIKKIVDSSVIDQLRKCRREEGVIYAEKANIISEIQTGYWAQHRDQRYFRLVIGKALCTLLESRRRAVQLYLLNMSIEEIALLNGWSQDKARNLLYRGLNDLKCYLAKWGEINED